MGRNGMSWDGMEQNGKDRMWYTGLVEETGEKQQV